MLLYHATPRKNLFSISQNGLDPKFAKGKSPVIWLHTHSRRHWAILHTMHRHQCSIDEVVIITVKIPKSRLRRRRRGLWITMERLTTLGNITDATEFTETPIA